MDRFLEEPNAVLLNHWGSCPQSCVCDPHRLVYLGCCMVTLVPVRCAVLRHVQWRAIILVECIVWSVGAIYRPCIDKLCTILWLPFVSPLWRRGGCKQAAMLNASGGSITAQPCLQFDYLTAFIATLSVGIWLILLHCSLGRLSYFCRASVVRGIAALGGKVSFTVIKHGSTCIREI